MPCESYKQALTDTVAAGQVPARELATHLRSCSACRAAFAAEQELFAALESGVQAISNAEIPSSLLAGVRVRLAEQPVQQSYWLLLAGAAITAAVLSVAVGLYRGSVRERPGKDLRAASSVSTTVTPAAVSSLAVPRRQAGPAHLKALGRSRSARPLPLTEVAVLIPEGQRRAFDRLLAGLQDGSVKADVFGESKQEQPPQERPPLSPLAIAPMEIKPLAPVSEESASPKESSNR